MLTLILFRRDLHTFFLIIF
ncbi:hypothetical protein BIW11_03540 [Tropilaelaps mercedesae]|uniref:Uncharacterized protein n=1 Tax=Tropilaelaps mercedesae TaxID=418985 RepID=A0A1V9XJ95_9ACAR|nr:hypothetical protein BIW11_03540 [Tropilaelaps mercedesae]